MFARTAAAEVVSGQQDWAAWPSGVFRMKSGFRVAVRVVAPVVEELIAEADFGGGLQKASGDDLVGVDVVDRTAAPGGW